MRGHAWDTLVGNMLLAYVCSAGGMAMAKSTAIPLLVMIAGSALMWAAVQ